MSFKMAVLQGGVGGRISPMCVLSKKTLCGIGLNHEIFENLKKVVHVKIVVLAEILPRDFLQTLGNHY